MSHWTFVALAYAAALTGTIGLIWSSYSGMRRAEGVDERQPT